MRLPRSGTDWRARRLLERWPFKRNIVPVSQHRPIIAAGPPGPSRSGSGPKLVHSFQNLEEGRSFGRKIVAASGLESLLEHPAELSSRRKRVLGGLHDRVLLVG